MLDQDLAAVSESAVCRVLREADLLSRWTRSSCSSGQYLFKPTAQGEAIGPQVGGSVIFGDLAPVSDVTPSDHGWAPALGRRLRAAPPAPTAKLRFSNGARFSCPQAGAT